MQLIFCRKCSSWNSLLFPSIPFSLQLAHRAVFSFSLKFPGKTFPLESTVSFILTIQKSQHYVTHHILNLRKCNLECDVQNFICILYWTKSIRVVFKKVIEQLPEHIFHLLVLQLLKKRIWIKLQCYEYFKAWSNRPRTSIGSIIPTYHPTYLPTYTYHQLGTSSGSSGVISLADLQGQHETVRSWNTSLQLEHLIFLWPTQHSTKKWSLG